MYRILFPIYNSAHFGIEKCQTEKEALKRLKQKKEDYIRQAPLGEWTQYIEIHFKVEQLN